MKEREDAPEPQIPTPERTHPNHVTASGLRELRARRAATTDQREIERLDRSIESAIVLGPPKNRSKAAFGATVRVDDGGKFSGTFTIVGDDEADPAAGKIAFTSPLGEALNGARVGSKVTWHRPAGDLRLTVRDVSYQDDEN
jgi:transcription elongation factor GreB